MIKELFTKFTSVYPAIKSSEFHSDLNTNIITEQIPELLKKAAAIPDSYKIYGSVGKGGWNEIPWVAILDKEITESTQNGYYIVFLYSADLKKLYLTLGVGWSQFANAYGVKDGKIQQEKIVRQLRTILRSPLQDFSFGRIDLSATKTRGKGYEVGEICYKLYQLNNLPSDDAIINDVRNLMGVYRELKGLVGKDILNLQISDEEIINEEINKKVVEASEIVFSPPEAKKKIIALINSKNYNLSSEKVKVAKYIERNRKFAELIKQAANYTCEICGEPPFKTKSGGLYAEAHHTLELSKFKKDFPDIMICVCSQCHKVLTYGTDEELEKRKILKTTRLQK